MLDSIAQGIIAFADVLMNVIVLILLLAAIFFTLRLLFVQVRRFREAWDETFRNRATTSSGALGPLRTFFSSLSTTTGVGNIAGVATAIVSGGPGALFWIWCFGFFGMAMKFSEAVLGLKYRVVDGENVLAGPMYYLRDGIKSPGLAWTFAFFAGMAVLLTTPMTQPNSVAVMLDSQLRMSGINSGDWQISSLVINGNRLMIGCVMAVLTWLVVLGGIKQIGQASEKLAPLKVGLYMIGGLIVLVTFAREIPAALATVFHEAFSFKAATGGAAGTAILVGMRYGIARGVYANEAGYGSAAVMYGVAKSSRPDQQGLAAIVEVFIITFITSSISGLTILVTGTWNSGVEGPDAVSKAFNAAMPMAGAGGWMVAISMLLFGYSCLIGWSFYGEQYLQYIFGAWIVKPFRWIYCLLIPIGAISQVDVVWAWGDILNGIQVFPNLIGLILLSGLVAKFARPGSDVDE